MAQWQRLTNLCKKNKTLQEAVNNLYIQSCFPYKIRSHFSNWIEGTNWAAIDLNTEAGWMKADELYKELFSMLEATIVAMQDSPKFKFEITLDFAKAKNSIQTEFDGNIKKFVDEIKNCISEEYDIMVAADNNEELKRKSTQPSDYAIENLEIKQKLQQIGEELTAAELAASNMEREQEVFSTNYRKYSEEISKIDRYLASLQPHQKQLYEDRKKTLLSERETIAVANFERRNSLADLHIRLATSLAYILQAIWEEVRKYIVSAKLESVGLGSMKMGILEILDKMLDMGGQQLYRMIQQVDTALNLFRKVNFPEDRKKRQMEMVLKELSDDYMVMFLQKAFIIEPTSIKDRILRIVNNRSNGFNVCVRMLGGKALGISFSKPKVRLSLFAENDIPPESIYSAGICNIVNSEDKVLVLQHSSNTCITQFNNIQLRNIKRPENAKADENVAEQKFALVFFTTINVCNRLIHLKVVSQPFIMIPQNGYETMARGTLLWDTAFSEENRIPFSYRTAVPWSELATLLSNIFLHATGVALTFDKLDYLAKMIIRDKKIQNYETVLVSDHQVLKDKLPHKDFCFWKWFIGCLNLVVDCIKMEWQKGLVYGFISKEDAESKLLEMPLGTFLLRFSETAIEVNQKSDICGYLTLAVVEIDPETRCRKVFHIRDYLKPEVSKSDSFETKFSFDKKRKLIDILKAFRVADLDNSNMKKSLLQHLYPCTDRNFEGLFGPKSSSKSELNADGYLTPEFQILIDFSSQDRNRQMDDTGSEALSIASPGDLSSLSPRTNISDSGSIIADILFDDSLDVQMMHPKPIASVLPQQNEPTLPDASFSFSHDQRNIGTPNFPNNFHNFLENAQIFNNEDLSQQFGMVDLDMED